MKNISATILVFIFGITLTYSQDEFVKVFESNYQEWAWDVIQTKDEGFAIIGNTSKSNDDIIFMKTNKAGDTIFTRCIGGNGWDYAYSIKQTADNGYIIAGSTTSFGAGNYDLFLVKTDENGNVLWTRTFGGKESDGGSHVEIASDGGFIISGLTYSNGSNNGSVFLVKTDSLGFAQWEKYPDCGSEGCFGTDILITSDDNYVISGNTSDNHVFLIKTDSEGKKIWSKIYNYYSESFSESILETQDNGIIIVGTAYKYSAGGSYDSDVLIIRTDDSGDTLWTKRIGDRMYDYGNSIDLTSDGGYIITGTIENLKFYDKDIYLIKINHSGDTLWTRPYHLLEHDYGYSVKQTPDRGYIITGYTESDGGNRNIFLMKTDSLGHTDLPYDRENSPVDTTSNVDTTTNINHWRTPEIVDFLIYPNPVSDILYINQRGTQKLLVDIIDIRGNIIYEDHYSGENISIDISNFPGGFYLLKLKSNNIIHFSKIMIINSP